MVDEVADRTANQFVSRAHPLPSTTRDVWKLVDTGIVMVVEMAVELMIVEDVEDLMRWFLHEAMAASRSEVNTMVNVIMEATEVTSNNDDRLTNVNSLSDETNKWQEVIRAAGVDQTLIEQ